MNAWHIIVILVVLLLAAMFFCDSDRRLKEELGSLLAGRPEREEDEYYDEFFGATEIPRNVVSRIRTIFSEQIGVDLSALEADDDFSKEYSLIWELDSLADVEIFMAIEEEFDVKIDAGEASEMTTLRDISEVVWTKMCKNRMG